MANENEFIDEQDTSQAQTIVCQQKANENIWYESLFCFISSLKHLVINLMKNLF